MDYDSIIQRTTPWKGVLPVGDRVLSSYLGPLDAQLCGNYIYANGERVAFVKDTCTTIRYYLNDHLGSVMATVSPAGSMCDRYQYLPWGKMHLSQVSASTVARYMYTSQEYETELGYDMYYFGARYYDPELKIFMQVDPLHQKSPSLGPYLYCANNPMKYVDTDGKETQIYSTPIGTNGFNLPYKHIFIRVYNKALDLNTTRGYYPQNRLAGTLNILGLNFKSGNKVVLKVDDPSELGEVNKLEKGEESNVTYEATLNPPDGMTVNQHDQLIIDAADSYDLSNIDYGASAGPNSNTIVDDVTFPPFDGHSVKTR